MMLAGEQVLLRIYLRSADRTPHVSSAERIVAAARSEGLAGATVLQGVAGFGSRGVSGKSSMWSLVQHAPVIVEIVDAPETISRFVDLKLADLMINGLATLERAYVMMYRQRAESAAVSLKPGVHRPALSTLPAIQNRGNRMTVNDNGMLLRVFIGESDRDAAGRPLHDSILAKARELGLSGATVLRGIEGFGANSVVHKSKLLEMSSDLPILIEIVEDQAKINLLLPWLEHTVKEGMITIENVRILLYRHDPADAH